MNNIKGSEISPLFLIYVMKFLDYEGAKTFLNNITNKFKKLIRVSDYPPQQELLNSMESGQICLTNNQGRLDIYGKLEDGTVINTPGIATKEKAGLMSPGDKSLIETLRSSSTLRVLFEACGAVYDNETGGYIYNELTLTEEEMTQVLMESLPLNTNNHTALSEKQYTCRTNLKPAEASQVYDYVNFNSNIIEVLNISRMFPSQDFMGWLSNCPKLKKIIGKIQFLHWDEYRNLPAFKQTDGMSNCPLLEYVNIDGLCFSFDLSNCKNLSKESVLYAINHSKELAKCYEGPSEISLVIDIDLYDELKYDSDIQQAIINHPWCSISGKTFNLINIWKPQQ